MNKQDVIDAINNVIVTNNQKGITAESLARVLLDMLEVTPESSGSEFYTLAIGDLFGETPLTEEQKAHNAELYRKMTEVDFTSIESVPPVFCAGLPTMMDFADGEMAFILSIPAGMNADYTIMGYCILIILNEDGSLIHQLPNA